MIALRDGPDATFDRADVLVNNAVIMIDKGGMSVLDLDMDTLQRTLDTNFIGALRVTQAHELPGSEQHHYCQLAAITGAKAS